MTSRRQLLKTGAALGGMLLLAGCGFQLRGTAQLPFKSLYVGINDTTDLGALLRRYVNNTTSTVVEEDPTRAEARLAVMSERRDRNVLSLDASGRVREFELLYIVEFRVHDGKGYDFVPPTTVTQKRDLTFNDSQTLAKDNESVLLYRDMQAEAVQQILRRMAAADGTKYSW